MTSIVRWSLGHKRLVVAIWILLTIAGIASANSATKALNTQYSNPGHESYTVNQTLAATFNNGGAGAPMLAVVTLPAGVSATSPAVTADLRSVQTRIEQAVPGVRAASLASTGNPAFVSHDGRTTFVIAYPPPTPNSYGTSPAAVKAANNALRGVTIDGAPINLTGLDALAAQTGSKSGPSLLAESMIGGLGALIVLGFVFGSFLAVVPLMAAIVSIMTCLLIIWGLASLTAVSQIVEYLIALVGLGIAIDYTLLVVVRWREERARDRARRRGDRPRYELCGPRGRLQRHCGGHRAALADRDPGALPAQRGVRRHADPAGQRRRHDHPAAGHPGHHRPAARLAPHPA